MNGYFQEYTHPVDPANEVPTQCSLRRTCICCAMSLAAHPRIRAADRKLLTDTTRPRNACTFPQQLHWRYSSSSSMKKSHSRSTVVRDSEAWHLEAGFLAVAQGEKASTL